MAKGGVTTSVSVRISPPEWTRVNMVGAPATGSAKAKARRAPCARSVHSQQPSTQQLWRWAGIIVHTDTRVSDLNKQTSF